MAVTLHDLPFPAGFLDEPSLYGRTGATGFHVAGCDPGPSSPDKRSVASITCQSCLEAAYGRRFPGGNLADGSFVAHSAICATWKILTEVNDGVPDRIPDVLDQIVSMRSQYVAASGLVRSQQGLSQVVDELHRLLAERYTLLRSVLQGRAGLRHLDQSCRSHLSHFPLVVTVDDFPADRYLVGTSGHSSTIPAGPIVPRDRETIGGLAEWVVVARWFHQAGARAYLSETTGPEAAVLALANRGSGLHEICPLEPDDDAEVTAAVTALWQPYGDGPLANLDECLAIARAIARTPRKG